MMFTFLNVYATGQSEDSSYVSRLSVIWVSNGLEPRCLMKSRLEKSSQRLFCPLCSFFSVRSSDCRLLLFAVLDPDEQEVVVEVPRVVQNPPKPVMTTRPTAVKATGIVVWVFLNSFSTVSFFRIKLCLYTVF